MASRGPTAGQYSGNWVAGENAGAGELRAPWHRSSGKPTAGLQYTVTRQAWWLANRCATLLQLSPLGRTFGQTSRRYRQACGSRLGRQGREKQLHCACRWHWACGATVP